MKSVGVLAFVVVCLSTTDALAEWKIDGGSVSVTADSPTTYAVSVNNITYRTEAGTWRVTAFLEPTDDGTYSYSYVTPPVLSGTIATYGTLDLTFSNVPPGEYEIIVKVEKQVQAMPPDWELKDSKPYDAEVGS